MISEYPFEVNIEEFARELAARTGTATRYMGDEIVFKTCPYCRGRGRDNEYKFHLNSRTGKFQCKRASCGRKGNLITLSKEFDISLGEKNDEYFQYRQRKQFRTPIIKSKIPAYTPKDAILDYMQKRGISADICERYHLSLKKDSDNIMSIPHFSEDGEIVTIKYRKLDFNPEIDSSKEWFESNMKPILFGMAQCKDFKQLVITEGQIDAMSLAQAGVLNPTSVPNGALGFTWMPYCYDFLQKFEEIIIFGDYEHGKVTLVDHIAKNFEKKKVKQVRGVDYKDCKDANELLVKYGPEAITEAISNAELVSKGRILDMTEVELINPEDLPGIPTGFKSLDDLLCGGLHFGQLAIITGKRGDGKSTFASQIIANALSELDRATFTRFKTFIYSGELTNSNVKAWMFSQLAGKTLNSAEDEALIEEIKSFTRDRAYMYDSSFISTEFVDVPDIVEEAIVKYGCKILLIDNLMTALQSDKDDFYREQSSFVGKLATLCKKYEVIILLVAHPRKGISQDMNDWISGASGITDRADVVIGYLRNTENENDTKRYLSVSKNRLTGRLLLPTAQDMGKCIQVIYDSKSRRIIEAGTAPRLRPWDIEPPEKVMLPDFNEPEPDEVPFE